MQDVFSRFWMSRLLVFGDSQFKGSASILKVVCSLRLEQLYGLGTLAGDQYAADFESVCCCAPNATYLSGDI